MTDQEDPDSVILIPCIVCSRTFSQSIIDRHIKVCEKNASKKRKVFDSYKTRVHGTDLEEFIGPPRLPGQLSNHNNNNITKRDKSPVKKSNNSATPKWKQTHESLLAALRAARGGNVEQPVGPSKPPGNEQCPHCERNFGPKAFDRHVEWCREHKSRIKQTTVSAEAKGRLEARTKYRAPLMLKHKMTTKEKYSPMPVRKLTPAVTSTSSNNNTPHITSTKTHVPNITNNKPNLSHFSRQSPSRSSLRQRSVSPSKNKQRSTSVSSTTPKSTNKYETPIIKINKKEVKNDRSTNLSSQDKIRSANIYEDGYDPVKAAEKQMLALMSWPSVTDLKQKSSKSPLPPVSPTRLQTSPTSAFTKYNPNTTKEVKNAINNGKTLSEPRIVNLNKKQQEIPPTKTKSPDKDFNQTYSAVSDWEEIFQRHFDLNSVENNPEKRPKTVKSALDGLVKTPEKQDDNSLLDSTYSFTSTPKTTKNTSPRSNTYRKECVTPPDDFQDLVVSGRQIPKEDRNSGVSLSSLSFCSQISDTTIGEDEFLANPILPPNANTAASIRNIRKKTCGRYQSVFEERNKMLFAKTFDLSSSDENVNNKCSRITRSQSAMDGHHNDYSSCRGDFIVNNNNNNNNNNEDYNSRRTKISGDSAYSSLNRRSPHTITQAAIRDNNSSSSSSDTSLPQHNDTVTKGNAVTMSKFCHECGAKYPVTIAKFCCECGVKRLVI